MKKKTGFIIGGVALATLVIVAALIIVLVTGGDADNDSKKSNDGETSTVTEATSDNKEIESDAEKETDTETEKETEAESNTAGKVDISDVENKDKDESKAILAQSTLDFGTTSYKEAYLAIIGLYKNIYNQQSVLFDLIYFDEDDVPELVAEVDTGLTMYTFKDGLVYKAIDSWGYGAAGNQGYAYLPYMGVVRNYNTDHMGIILYETYIYIDVTSQGVKEERVCLRSEHFEDANGNGDYDAGEKTGVEYDRYYLDEEEITKEKYNEYVVNGEFVTLYGYCGWDSIEQALNKPASVTVKDSECKKAYKEVIEQYESAHSTSDAKYDLIDFNGDNVPELVCDVKDYYVSMYTYKDGKVYVVMDDWGYGAFGNYGYQYCPSKNVVMNVNSDMGGAIYNTYYGKMNDNCEIEDMYTLKEEHDDLGIDVKYYIDEEEISELEYEDYMIGGSFFYIEGQYTKEEMEVFLK